jgi:hypothetical protein
MRRPQTTATIVTQESRSIRRKKLGQKDKNKGVEVRAVEL